MQDIQSKEKHSKEEQMKQVFEKLVSVENDLSRERKRMHTLMDNKEKIIKKQQDKIAQLQETNTRLLAGLQRLKVHYSQQNGRTEANAANDKTQTQPSNTHDTANQNQPSNAQDSKALKQQDAGTRNRVLRSSQQRSANSHYRRVVDMEESDDSHVAHPGVVTITNNPPPVGSPLHSKSPNKNSKRSILWENLCVEFMDAWPSLAAMAKACKFDAV